MVTIPLFIGFVLLILLAISLSARASAHQTKRMWLIFVVLPTLGAVDSMQASTVNYAEGFYTVPYYMTEVPADDVRGYDTNPQGRSFVGRDSNGQVFLLVASYRDTSQIADEKNLGHHCHRSRAAPHPGNAGKLCRRARCEQDYR